MKIALVNQPQDPIEAGEEQRGSVAIVNWELAKRLAQRYPVTVYAPRAAGQPDHERWKNIEIRRVPFVAKLFHKAMQLVAGRIGTRPPYINSPLYYREYFMQVAHELNEHPVDVLHFPQQLQFAAHFKRAMPRAKIVLHMHQDELAQLDYNLLHRQLANIDAVVTVSDFVTDRARARFPGYAAAIHTIGNGVDVGRFLPDLARDRDANVRTAATAAVCRPHLSRQGCAPVDRGLRARGTRAAGYRADSDRQGRHAAFRPGQSVVER